MNIPWRTARDATVMLGGVVLLVLQVFGVIAAGPTLVVATMMIIWLPIFLGMGPTSNKKEPLRLYAPGTDLRVDANRWRLEHELMPDYCLPGDPWHGEACTVCHPARPQHWYTPESVADMPMEDYLKHRAEIMQQAAQEKEKARKAALEQEKMIAQAYTSALQQSMGDVLGRRAATYREEAEPLCGCYWDGQAYLPCAKHTKLPLSHITRQHRIHLTQSTGPR